jgi:mRNA interferase MazF
VIFNPFDVVVYAFPYVEKAGFVKRPALILSEYKCFGAGSGVSIVAMITSAKASVWPLDISISDLSNAGLTNPCIVRMKLNTAANDLIERRIGSLSDVDRQAVTGSLRKLFAFL